MFRIMHLAYQLRWFRKDDAYRCFGAIHGDPTCTAAGPSRRNRPRRRTILVRFAGTDTKRSGS